MIDLREHLQELADAAIREGVTPGPAHAIRRGRQRRRRLTVGRDLPAVGPPATVPLQPLARIDLHRDLSGAGGSRRAELVGYVRSEQYRRLGMIVAVPPEPGETTVCWTAERFELGGGGSMSPAGATSADIPLTVGGSNSDVYGTVQGQATRRAARVRVEFSDGRRPLDLPVIDTGGRYPVNSSPASSPRTRPGPGIPAPGRWPG